MEDYKCIDCFRTLEKFLQFSSCTNTNCKTEITLYFDGDYKIHYKNLYITYFKNILKIEHCYENFNYFESKINFPYNEENIIKIINKTLDNLIFV